MSDKTVDLRSDTITLPTEEMQEAMARAPLGDDVYGEDPTVNRLQELAANVIGVILAGYKECVTGIDPKFLLKLTLLYPNLPLFLENQYYRWSHSTF